MDKLVVRVYGVCLNREHEVLIADEVHRGKAITKFPGGGLELGEGPIECVQREFLEETGHVIRILRHFYTTDFFVRSYFEDSVQILSIYYLVEFADQDVADLEVPSLDSAVRFRWQAVDTLNAEDFSFVIDQRVATLILSGP